MIKDSIHMDEPSCLSPNSNKENLKMSTNKITTPSLSMEPQKMKRSRKSRGNNSRKSLAWDRAFLTEEGVLDSLELSMLTGVPCKPCGEELSTISEVGKSLTPTNSNSNSRSTDIQSVEENLFEELPSGRLNSEKMMRCTLPRKQDSLSGDHIPLGPKTQTIIPLQSVTKSGPKGRVLEIAILNSFATNKRVLNANTLKVSARNSKIPKMPVLKQESGSLHTAARNTTPHASQMKCDRIAQPAAGVKKKTGLKGHSNARSVRNATTAGPECISTPSKPFSQNDRKNAASSSGEMHSVTNRQTHYVHGKKPLESISDKAPLTSEMGAPKAVHETRKFASSSCQKSDNAVGTMKLVQAGKPSGLRMPSPSLRFFSEPKAPVANSLLQQNLPSSNHLKSGIPTPPTLGGSYFHDVKLRHALGETSKGVDSCVSGNMASDPWSTSKSSVSSRTGYKLHEKATVYENVKELEAKVLYDAQSPKYMNNQRDMHHIVNVVKGNLECEHFSLKDELMHGKENKLALCHLESKVENFKPSDVFPEARGAAGNVRESSQVPCETYLSMQLKGPSEPKKVSEDINVGMLITEASDALSECRDADWNVLESSHVECETCPAVQLEGVSEANMVTKDQLIQDALYDSSVMLTRELSFSNVDSKEENFKPDDFSESRDADGVLETCATVQVKSVSEANKVAEHEQVVDGQSELSAMNNGHKLKSQIETTINHCNQRGHDGSPISVFDVSGPGLHVPELNQDVKEVSPRLHCFGVEDLVDNVPLKLENSNYEMHVTTGRSGEESCHLYAHRCTGQADRIFANEKSNSQNMDGSIRDHSPRSFIANCNIAGGHNQHIGAKQLHFSDTSGCLLNQEELTKHHEANGKFQEPNILSEESSSVQTHINVLSQGELYHEKSPENHNENVLNMIPEVITIAGNETKGNHTLPQLCSLNCISMEYHIGETQVQSTNEYETENRSTCNPSLTHHQCIEVANNLHNQQEKQPELQNTSLLMCKTGQCDHGLNSNNGMLLRKSSSERIPEGIAQETAMHRDRAQEFRMADGALSGCSENRSLVENHADLNTSQFSSQITHLDFQLPVRRSEDRTTSSYTDHKIAISCSPDKGQGSSLRTSSIDGVENCMAVDELDDLPREAETRSSLCINFQNDENKSHLEGIQCTGNENDKMASRKTVEDGMKQQTLAIKAPSNALPFSDEWLAAVEAAGEGILSMKSGPVQNSPPDKPLSEPGPWSPVKRKSNQAIGPFDCTKFSNNQH
ncbi:hypothetical protein Ancab_010709 [Ancistrocladus abbreviatus]